MKPESSISTKKGFSLLELIVTIGAIGIVVLSIAQLSQIFLRIARLTSERIEAAFLLQESAEALRFLRDDSWHDNIDTITTGTPHYLLFSSGAYSMTTTEQPLIGGKFDRIIMLSDVFRDATTDDIVQTDGVLSTSTKRIEIAISWRQVNATSTETIELFLSDIFDN